MGLFSKHTRQQPGAGVASNGNGVTGRSGSGGGAAAAHAWPYSMSTRPSFGQWLKHTWLDILSMAVLGAIGLGVYEAPPAPTRSFAIDYTDRSVVFPQFAYPMREEIVPIWAAAMLAALVPIVVILFMQIRIRSFWDVNNGVLGLLYSLITAAVFQVFIKWLIGGLRPHFLDVCKPDLSRASNAPGVKGAGYNGAGYTGIFYTSQVCTGNQREINDALESMPSGHTTAAFAGFVYLYLYLNAKLKVFANYHPALWKLVALYAPLLGACLIGGALTVDEYHNWYDVLAGAVIGTAFAFSSYRMVYAAVWDWRFNHIPLNRGAPFAYSLEAELADAVWTRKVGWGPGGAGGFGMAGGHPGAHGGLGGHHHPNGAGVGAGAGAGAGAGGFSHPRKPVPSGAGHRGDDMV